MSILRKPYEISVWDDVWDNTQQKFVEKKLGVIGSDTMEYAGRAIEPNFSRNVNGVKKLSFKMYKHFIDTVTGEKVDNPYSDWLVNERKVKLYYKDKWHDFIVKNIVEDSKSYLYTYQLEDALVQELSKNGFGVTLDMKLRNNMGTANGLAAEILKETDWNVASDSEVFVERVDEALVYVTINTGSYSGRIKHIIDQDKNNRTTGVTIKDATFTKPTITALAFYSSCTGKPHRFQFIYLDKLNESGAIPQLSVYKDDNRTIAESNCQYFIDFDGENDYKENGGFYLPSGINTVSKKEDDGHTNTTLSYKYRGERYGFAQQSEYIPVLDRYCSKYYCPVDGITWSGVDANVATEGKNYKLEVIKAAGGLICSKEEFVDGQVYSLQYTIEQTSGKGPMRYIGGHARPEVYEQISFTVDGVPKNDQYANGTQITSGKHVVEFVFKFKAPQNEGDNNSLYIQPNRSHYQGVTYLFDVIVSDLSITNLYYGYLNADYKSPALTTNLISGSALDSTHGWTGTRLETGNEVKKATVEAKFGYFDGKFKDSIEEIKNGTFNPDKTNYKPYLKFKLEGSNSCVVNSCIYDNRVLVGSIAKSDKWALKYRIWKVDDSKVTEKVTEATNLTFKLKECKYSPSKDCYEDDSGAGIKFEDFEYDSESRHWIASMKDESAECSQKEFKNKSQVRLVITGPAGEYYIEEISLFKASYANGNLITLEEQGKNLDERTVEKTYYYFSPSALDNITEASELKPVHTSKTLSYGTYKPVYNTGAEKVRSITAKESNYFNLLQSIAETFEAWLILEVVRDANGGVTEKYVKFKNYIGKDNYAGFRYGVNLQGIQRTFESKEIVTKLMVKANANEYAPNGFCTIQRADANPTGESCIYDFQYYFNRGLMNARDYLETIYIWNNTAKGPDIQGTTGINLQGYYPRIKALNEKLQERNEVLINTAKDLVQYKAELETATAGVDAATSGLEQVKEDFLALTKREFPTKDKPLADETDSEMTGRTDVKKLLQEYATYYSELTNYTSKKAKAEKNLEKVQQAYNNIETKIEDLKNSKIALNQLFFQKYSRFIQEGTWIDEEYVDDDLYYNDALSVLYNSCYPQVAYQINVLELSGLEGYELFDFELGDKTYAEDPEFFGENVKEEVIVSEFNENLDDASKNTIKVQNFKNQFQDLFQKITATVQQTQYRTGSYERAVALAEANNERKNQFLSDALDTASARLTAAGQQSVTWGADGITVQDVDSPSDMIRMVGGAILLSKQDKNGEQKWVTGVTSDGISASLVTAGIINAGEITIMNYDEPVFRWDAFGITAYDANWYDSDIGAIISGVNSRKFVRFDKHGIYGINNSGVDDANWYPGDINEIDEKATFALTWEGLKVTGGDNVTLKLGKDLNDCMLLAERPLPKNDETGGEEVGEEPQREAFFGITNEGKIFAKGINIIDGFVDGSPLVSESYLEETLNSFDMTAKSIAIYNENLDGQTGITWNDVIFLAGKKVEDGVITDADNMVYLAGWTVTENQLTNGTIGASNSFGIYPTGLASSNLAGDFFFKDSLPKIDGEETDSWIMTAGTRFGLSKNGRMFSNFGKIGGWIIDTGGISYGTFGSYGSAHLIPNPASPQTGFGTQNKLLWTIGVGANFGVTSGGAVYAKELHASNSGDIAGWVINGNALTSDNIKIFSQASTNDMEQMDSLTYPGSKSSFLIQAGGNVNVAESAPIKYASKTIQLGLTQIGPLQGYTIDIISRSGLTGDLEQVAKAYVEHTYYDTDGKVVYSYSIPHMHWYVQGNSLTITLSPGGIITLGDNETFELHVDFYYSSTDEELKVPAFRLLRDGSLYVAGLQTYIGQVGPFSFTRTKFKGGEIGEQSSEKYGIYLSPMPELLTPSEITNYFRTTSVNSMHFSLPFKDRLQSLYFSIGKNVQIYSNCCVLYGWTFTEEGVYSPWKCITTAPEDYNLWARSYWETATNTIQHEEKELDKKLLPPVFMT